jgi:hypothetical protein
LARTKKFLARTKKFLARTKKFLARTKKFLARTKKLLVRTKKLLARTKKLLARTKKSYPPAFDAPDVGFECLPRVSGQPSKGCANNISINKKSRASIRCAAICLVREAGGYS